MRGELELLRSTVLKISLTENNNIIIIPTNYTQTAIVLS